MKKLLISTLSTAILVKSQKCDTLEQRIQTFSNFIETNLCVSIYNLLNINNMLEL